MPPAGHMRPGTDVREAILDWATCGAWREGTDLCPTRAQTSMSTEKSFQDLGAPPPDTDFFELRAQDFRVTGEMTDHYECFRFEAPVDETRFIRQWKRLLMMRGFFPYRAFPDENGEPNTNSPCNEINPSALTYAWAPGQGAQFPEGGLRLEPGQRMTLNIHYNNAAQHRMWLIHRESASTTGPSKAPKWRCSHSGQPKLVCLHRKWGLPTVGVAYRRNQSTVQLSICMRPGQGSDKSSKLKMARRTQSSPSMAGILMHIFTEQSLYQREQWCERRVRFVIQRTEHPFWRRRRRRNVFQLKLYFSANRSRCVQSK